MSLASSPALSLLLLLLTAPGVAADVPVWEIALAVGSGVLALLLCSYTGYLVMRNRRQTPADVEAGAVAASKQPPKLVPGQGKSSGSASGQGKALQPTDKKTTRTTTATKPTTSTPPPPLSNVVTNGLSQAAGAVGAVGNVASAAMGSAASAASSAVQAARTSLEDTDEATAAAKTAAAAKLSAAPTRSANNNNNNTSRIVDRAGQGKQDPAFARRSPRM